MATILTMVEKKQETLVEMTTKKIESCLSKLSEESSPQWGSMSAQHMIEHLEYTYRIASGEIQDFEIATPEKILDKVHATLYTYDKMPREYDFPLAEKSTIETLKHDDLASAKLKMLEARNEYLQAFKDDGEKTTKNVVFGHLNRYEWYLLERKHLNHHFEQFQLL